MASTPRANIGFFRALTFPFRGARFVYVDHRGLARYWLVPVVITTLLLSIAGYFAFDLRDELAGAMWRAPTDAGFVADALRFLHALFAWVLAGVAFALSVVAVALISNIIAAPFNDALSHEVERLVSGSVVGPPATFGSIISDLGRTVALELLKLALYAAVMLPMFVLSVLLPGVGQLLYTAFGFYFSASYFCLDYLDWPASRRQWTVGRRLAQLRRFPSTTLGFGLGVWAFLLVPLVNLLFMPAAVAGGTLLFLELHPESRESPDSP